MIPVTHVFVLLSNTVYCQVEKKIKFRRSFITAMRARSPSISSKFTFQLSIQLKPIIIGIATVERFANCVAASKDYKRKTTTHLNAEETEPPIYYIALFAQN